MKQVEHDIMKLLDVLEYHFFLMPDKRHGEIKSIVVSDCYYQKALWSITEDLDPGIENHEDLLILLKNAWISAGTYYVSCQRRSEEQADQERSRGHHDCARDTLAWANHMKIMVGSCDKGILKMLEFEKRVERAKNKKRG